MKIKIIRFVAEMNYRTSQWSLHSGDHRFESLLGGRL